MLTAHLAGCWFATIESILPQDWTDENVGPANEAVDQIRNQQQRGEFSNALCRFAVVLDYLV